MKYYPLAFLIAVFTFGCATLDISGIENLDQQAFQPSTLQVGYDLYDMRIDLIRQTEQDNDSTDETSDVPYHPIGFNLGNGLFFDLNGNLSFLVTELFEVSKNDDFTIRMQSSGFLNKSTEVYQKNEQSFTIEHKGLFNCTSRSMITDQDSIITFKGPFLSSGKIEQNDKVLTYGSGWFKTRVFRQEHGYYIKLLIGKMEYTLEDNVHYLDGRYIIRNHGNAIDIFERGLFNRDYLLFTLIRSDHEIYIYDRNYQGLVIAIYDNKLTVQENKTIERIYTVL